MFKFGKIEEPTVEVEEVVKPQIGMMDVNMYFRANGISVELTVGDDDPMETVLVDLETGDSTILSAEEYEDVSAKTYAWISEKRAALLKRALS